MASLARPDAAPPNPPVANAAPAGGLLQAVGALVPGIVLSGAVAFAGIQLARARWLYDNGIGALTAAIVIGMIVGNAIPARVTAAGHAGVTFSKQTLLRLGIILYGMRLTFQDVAQVGWRGVAVDLVMLSSTFALAWLAGTRIFGLDRRTAMLVGVGSSICGAAAVLATEPVLRARAEQVTIAVSTVVVFGTLAIFVYPALYRLDLHGGYIALSATTYGLFAGSTIHEVAQVVAAGHAVSDQAATVAVIAKLVRVLMLAPFLFLLSAFVSRFAADEEGEQDDDGNTMPAKRGHGVVVPWFAVAFMVVAGLNSLALLPRDWVAAILAVDNALLATAMAALGLTTHLAAMRQAGVRPLALALLLFAWLIVGGLFVTLEIGR